MRRLKKQSVDELREAVRLAQIWEKLRYEQ